MNLYLLNSVLCCLPTQVAVPEAAAAGTVFTISYEKPITAIIEDTNSSSLPLPDQQDPSSGGGGRHIQFAPDVADTAPASRSNQTDHYRYRQSEMIPATAQREGTLQKLNRHGRWQKRYFRCEGNYFKYFKKESTTVMLGVIDLRQVAGVEVVQVHGSRTSFSLKGTGGSVVISLAAPTMAARDDWIRFLARMIKERLVYIPFRHQILNENCSAC
jgi:hypothetical protein